MRIREALMLGKTYLPSLCTFALHNEVAIFLSFFFLGSFIMTFEELPAALALIIGR
jgi:hypothetical protein